MKSVVGVFKSRSQAERACAKLIPLGIPRDQINILTPDVTPKELAQVPRIAAEQPGMGKAMGVTVGSAVGLAGGFGLSGAIGSLLVPGVGPILAVSLAGGVLGAIGGGAAGAAAESSIDEGLPADELFVYEDALRQGHSVVVATAHDEQQAEAARGALEEADAESIDRARDMWWVGLRAAEKTSYEQDGHHFEQDERYFRCGFEAAQHSSNRGKSFEECRAQLGRRFPGEHNREPFRRGFERGRAYFDALRKRSAKRAGS